MDCLPQLHIAAIHDQSGFRSATPGIGALCRDGIYLGGAGYFSNSEGGRSAYAILGAQPWRIGTVRVGAFGGWVTGYKMHPSGMPWGAAAFSLPVSDYEVHLTVIPRVDKVTPLTAAFSITWRFP